MRMTILFSLLLLAAKVNWAQDDYPIKVQDDGGGGDTGGQGGGGQKKTQSATKKQSATKDAGYLSIGHTRDDGNGHHGIQFGDGLYVRDSNYQAVCFEMPVSTSPTPVRVQLGGYTNWSLTINDGLQLLSGNGSGKPYYNNNLVSIADSATAVIPDGVNGVITDPINALNYGDLNLDGTTTRYPRMGDQPTSPLQFFIRYCRKGQCPAGICH